MRGKGGPLLTPVNWSPNANRYCLTYLHLNIHPERVHQRQVSLSASQEQETTVFCKVDGVRSEIWEGQIEHLPSRVDVNRFLE